MGGSVSHLSHPEHRLRRVNRNDSSPAVCGMCQRNVELGDVAYWCLPCRFVLHGTCYRYQERMSGFFGHSLTLAAVARSRDLSCSICAERFDASGLFVYSCDQKADHCHGFHAHPRCCNLPRKISTTHHPHSLSLRPPPPPPGNGSRASACVACRNTRQTVAWSYQCLTCVGVELCIACRAARSCCNQCGCGAVTQIPVCAGLTVGGFLKGLLQQFGVPFNSARPGLAVYNTETACALAVCVYFVKPNIFVER